MRNKLFGVGDGFPSARKNTLSKLRPLCYAQIFASLYLGSPRGKHLDVQNSFLITCSCMWFAPKFC